MDNYYETLEISPRARTSVITAAYKALMKEYHPDNGGDSKIAQRINEARDILLDAEKRKRYDHKREDVSGKVIGNYRVLELIAQGGFGKTYKGEQIHLGAPVCIKHAHYVSPQDEEILLKEASAIWDLRHFSIPTMRDVLKLDDGSIALVMSYVPGPTLEQVIDKVGKLDPEHVCWITERVLNALKYLHYNGVVHGDVKPQNIIVQPQTHMVVIVDYGLSAIRPSADSENHGYTPFFASPEQERGGVIVPESDFYSLAMTMIYALGGDVATRRVPSGVNDELCDFIKRLLVYNVLSRPSWHKEDLCDTIQRLRLNLFGRASSDMKPIEGLEEVTKNVRSRRL
ncbi:protein kinase [Candidatus Woesearchaeota archaeon]|nr:protein kinase [Candidatus Woesearchaeota archaeon]